MDVAAIAFTDATALVDVSAIDREAGNHLPGGIAQRLASEIARLTVSGRDLIEQMREHAHFTGHGAVHDQLLAVVDEAGHVDGLAQKTPVERGKGPFMALMNKDAVELISEFVASGAIDRPLRRQLLVDLQDFFCGNE